MQTYEVGYHAAEKTCDDTITGLLQTLDVATTTADAQYASGMATAATSYATQAASEACDYAMTAAHQQESYSNNLAADTNAYTLAAATAYDDAPADPSQVTAGARRNRSA